MNNETNLSVVNKLKQLIEPFFENIHQLVNFIPDRNSLVVLPKSTSFYHNSYHLLKLALSELDGATIKTYGGNFNVINIGDTKFVLINAQSQKHYEWLVQYYSYSLNVLISKLLVRTDFKYTDEGLIYKQLDNRDNHRSEIETLIVTMDFEKILRLLDLDQERFKSGFANTEELFDFFSKTPFLNVEKFTGEIKDPQAPLLPAFKEYLETKSVVNENYKPITNESIVAAFPEINLEEEFSRMQEKADKKLERINKFNGRTIMEQAPEIPIANVGQALKDFKHSFGSGEAYRQFVDAHTTQEILLKFKETIKTPISYDSKGTN